MVCVSTRVTTLQVLGMARRLFVTSSLLFILCLSPCTALQDWCYTAGGVAGIVIATVVVTVVFGGLSLAAVWYLWKRRKASAKIAVKPGGVVPKLDPKPEFAFDNPYFRNEDNVTVDVPDGGQEEHYTNVQLANGKANTGSKGKKVKNSKSNPFASVFYTTKKQKTMDDSCLTVEPERTVVSLKGHDFTGLGFNICGNMRDGIFVKDVLHRGPASESGKIKAGDRIISVTVSFCNMVYEDALTILSYASPYDVRLELESPSEKSNGIQEPSAAKRLASSSFSGGGHRLFHPLYRSQSIDDLTQIGKDSYPVHGLIPKRSQSMGVAAQKLKSHFESDAPTTKPIAVTGSLNERMLAQVMIEETKWKMGLDTDQSELEDPLPLPRDRSIGPSDSFRESLKLDAHICSLAGESAAVKRRAPHTPPPSLNKTIVSIETTAQVHQSENKDNLTHSVESKDSVERSPEDSAIKSSLDSLGRKRCQKTLTPQDDKTKKEAPRGYNSSWNQLERTHCAGRKGNQPTVVKVQVTSRPPSDIEQRAARNNGLPSSPLQIPVISPITRHPDRDQKEVIEITERELDDVMMSHRQFLLRKAMAAGSPASPKKGNEFESWSYSEDERKQINGISQRASSGRWKSYEIGEYGTRTPDSGYSNAIVVPSGGRSSFRVAARPATPPPQLESPANPSIVSHMRL